MRRRACRCPPAKASWRISPITRRNNVDTCTPISLCLDLWIPPGHHLDAAWPISCKEQREKGTGFSESFWGRKKGVEAYYQESTIMVSRCVRERNYHFPLIPFIPIYIKCQKLGLLYPTTRRLQTDCMAEKNGCTHLSVYGVCARKILGISSGVIAVYVTQCTSVWSHIVQFFVTCYMEWRNIHKETI